MTHEIEVIRHEDPVPFEEAYREQIARRDAVERGEASNALFLLEHPPVITLGRNWKPPHLLRSREELRGLGIDVIEADRGGDVTYHGPGQLVAYPILDLRCWQTSIRWYLRSLEAILIRQLARYGLDAGRLEGHTGVWVNGAKVAAIGVGIHNWVTFHGIALNVAPDMRHFSYIVPCGIADKPVTSLHLLMDAPPAMDRVMADFDAELLGYFADGSSVDLQ